MAQVTQPLQHTPLHAAHRQGGAKLVAFGGWEMPVQYTSIVEEHHAVRERAGLFDISHMGQFLAAGPTAARALDQLLTNAVDALAVGHGRYSLLCNPAGGIVDDLIVYRIEPTVFLLVVNASRCAADLAWLTAHAPAPFVLDHDTRAAAVALQGPRARQILPEAAALTAFQIARLTVAGKLCWVAATGYTGEDGFELFCAAADAVALWTELLARGQPHGLLPCGLGARDTLRLEACLPLYGNDLAEDTTPLEAGLGRFVAMDKGEFIGRAALQAQRETGIGRQLVAFRMTGQSPPPRPHYPILAAGQRLGEVTSGTQSPTLHCGIGLGYVPPGTTAIDIEIRGRPYPAVVAKKPLYKRSS